MSVALHADGKEIISFLPDCARTHSVRLSEEIASVFSRASLSPRDMDFFAAVVGPGSFTGIRIGVATVKGLCLSCDKPALQVTSFDALAYAETEFPLLALVDAGHGCFYACGYEAEGKISLSPRFCTAGETEELLKTYRPVRYVSPERKPAQGLIRCAIAKHNEARGAEFLSAVYLRKSSAEEHR